LGDDAAKRLADDVARYGDDATRTLETSGPGLQSAAENVLSTAVRRLPGDDLLTRAETRLRRLACNYVINQIAGSPLPTVGEMAEAARSELADMDPFGAAADVFALSLSELMEAQRKTPTPLLRFYILKYQFCRGA
jgi:hypothetical protein